MFKPRDRLMLEYLKNYYSLWQMSQYEEYSLEKQLAWIIRIGDCGVVKVNYRTDENAPVRWPAKEIIANAKLFYDRGLSSAWILFYFVMLPVALTPLFGEWFLKPVKEAVRSRRWNISDATRIHYLGCRCWKM